MINGEILEAELFKLPKPDYHYDVWVYSNSNAKNKLCWHIDRSFTSSNDAKKYVSNNRNKPPHFLNFLILRAETKYDVIVGLQFLA